MNAPTPMILMLLSAALACGSCTDNSPQHQQVEASPAPSWQRHCSVSGIKNPSQEDATYLARLAKNCTALDACMLACIRSGCADIGGGCAHACSGNGTDEDLARDAEEYAAKTAYFCKWQRPN